jgi:SPX domain protein involved in polyphosphate accumulation
VKRLVTDERDDEAIRHRQELSEDRENQQDEGHALDDGSDDDLMDDEDSDESYDALEDRFHGLEEEVATLVADVHDLALHTKLNITGFMKILKVSFSAHICNFPILPFFRL